jgi:glycosyltransferase involved in cell wall biosynthesis
MKRILFVGALHHPEALQAQQSDARQRGAPVPLFPATNMYHFYEKELRRRGYVLDVFWRNLPAHAQNDPSAARAERFTEGLTLRKLWQGALNRLPPQWQPALRARNAALLRHVERFQPEVVWLIGDNRVIFPETLAELKRRHGCRIVYASGTSPIVFSHPIERAAARLYDWALVNDFYHGVQWQELGTPNMLCLPLAGVDPDFHAPRPLHASPDWDVSFVGTLVPRHLYSERVAALAALREFRLGVWSVHDIPTELREHARGAALGEETMRILGASLITVNPHGDFMRYGGNMRLFEAAGLGVFQLVDDRPGVKEWFRVGEHLITYRNPADLRDKVAYYLAHEDERREMAQAARAHAHAHHTYAQRVDALQAHGVL